MKITYELKEVLQSVGNMIRAHTWVVPILHYTPGIIDFMLAELEAAEQKTWKIMTMHHALYPRLIDFGCNPE